MSTRQHRFNDIEEIKKQIPALQSRKINLVLRDGTVVYGELHKSNVETIVMKNMRLRKKQFAITEIAELYFDTIV